MNIEDFRLDLNDGINRYFNNQIKLAPSNEAKILLKRLKQVSSLGKRFRPSLFFLIYKAYGGQLNVVNIALAIELTHQALLIHDDLIDQDTIRHTKKNITGLYLEDGSPNVAKSISLLAGDLLLTNAYQLIADDLNLADQTKVKSVSLFISATTQAIYGQQLDTINIKDLGKPLTAANLKKINFLKTANYSTILPVNLVSLLLDLPTTEVKKLIDFGKSLGIYFQYLNDHQDYFKLDGSSYSLKDFSSGKLTYPYLMAKKLAKPSEIRILTSLSTKSLTKADKLKVVNILKSCGAFRASQDLINRYYQTSVSDLNKLDINEKNKLQLLALIDSIKV